MVLAIGGLDDGAFSNSGARGNITTFGERFTADRQSVLYANNLTSDSVAGIEAYDKRIDDVFQATGIKLPNPLIERVKATQPSTYFGAMLSERIRAGLEDMMTEEAFMQRLKELEQQHPDKAYAIRAGFEPRAHAHAMARDAERASQDAASRDRSAFGWAAGLAGGIVGSFQDPAQVIISAFGSAGTGRTLLYHALRAGAINAGGEAAIQPFVQRWRAEAGLPYGVAHAAANVAGAAVFGAGLDAAFRGAYRGMRVARGGEWIPPEERPGYDPNAPQFDPEAALDAAVARLPEDNPIRQAADGDPQKLIDALETADDPHIRELARIAEEEGLFAKFGIDDEWSHREQLAQAVRRAVAPDLEPMPGAPLRDAPPARGPDLSDEAPAPGRQFDIEGKPVRFTQLGAKGIVADPQTFQFKGGADAAGVTDRMSGVSEWDPLATGKIVVFQRADGTRVIADGHQRLGLAKRLIAEGKDVPRLDAYVFREADGWDPADVRAIAAKKNLQEGSGSVLDAAKIMRERPDIIDKSVPLSSGMMRTARSMTRLGDDAFDGVVAGVYPERWAAMVADIVPDKARHRDVLDELVGLAPDNIDQARIAINDIMSAPLTRETQLTLLGMETRSRSLLRERMRVLDAALKHLRADARVFRTLNAEADRIQAAGNRLAGEANAARADEAAQTRELIAALALSSGRVSDMLDDAAQAVAHGTSARMAGEAFANRVGDVLEREGLNGLTAAREAPAPRLDETGEPAFSDPVGEAAKAQIDDLEQRVLFSIRAYHGSPHDFDRFDMTKIGTGEGAQAYGHGLYFAESPGVARAYRESLSEAPKWKKEMQHDQARLRMLEDEAPRDWLGRKTDTPEIVALRGKIERLQAKAEDPDRQGRLYTVNIKAKPEEFLDWDKPLSAQPEKVRSALGEFAGYFETSRTIADGMRKLAMDYGGADMAAARLEQLGIPGIRYLDGDSRVGGAGTYNYVIFDDSLIEIKAKDGQPVTGTERDGVLFGLRQEQARAAASRPRYADAATAVTARAAEAMPDIRKDLDKIIARLPESVRLDVQDRIVFPMADGRTAELDGYFDPRDGIIRVALDSQNPARVARHEEIHALKNAGLFSNDEWATLRQAVADNGWREEFGTDARYKDVYGRRTNDPDRLEEMLDEEAIADAFARYERGERFGPTIDAIIERVVRFVKDVAEMLTGKGFRTAEDVFAAVERGEIGRRGMSAAQAQGFDTARVYYHGTRADFDAFDLNRTGETTGSPERAVFLTADPTEANNYAFGLLGDPVDGGRVLPVYVRGRMKTVAYDKPTNLFEDIKAAEIKAARAEGFDGITFLNVIDAGADGQAPTTVTAVFDPANIRSVNAEFDPAKEGMNGLMFSIREAELDSLASEVVAACRV